MVEQLVALIDGLGTTRLRIAIDGRTAAGKTSLGHELAHQLAPARSHDVRARHSTTSSVRGAKPTVTTA